MFLCRFAGYNDGTRSVVFKIERIDIQENEETGEMGTVPKERAFDISKCTLTLWSIEEVYINE